MDLDRVAGRTVKEITASIRKLLGFNVSPSQINRFSGQYGCQYSWRLQYLDRYQIQDKPIPVKRGNIWMSGGSLFHKMFEVVTKQYNPEPMIRAYKQDRMAEYILKLSLHVTPPDWRIFMTPIYKKFAENEEQRYKNILHFVYDEVNAFNYFVPFSEMKFKLAEGVTFIADRIYLVPNGMYGTTKGDEWLIHDFKPTGNKYTTNLNRQLTMMALFIEPLNHPLPLVGGYFYRNGVELPPKFPHGASIAALKRHLVVLETCIKTREFVKRFGWHCSKCEYLHQCKLSVSLPELLKIRREKRVVKVKVKKESKSVGSNSNPPAHVV